MRWERVAIGAAVLGFGIGLLAFTWDRDAAQQLGAALLGGAVIAAAVLTIESRRAERERQAAQERERTERAQRVRFTFHAPQATGNEDGLWWTCSTTLVNGSGYRVTDCRLVLLPADWTRQSEPAAPPTVLARLNPGQGEGLPAPPLPRKALPPEEYPPAVVASVEWTDHEGYRWRRWPDDSLQCVGRVPS